PAFLSRPAQPARMLGDAEDRDVRVVVEGRERRLPPPDHDGVAGAQADPYGGLEVLRPTLDWTDRRLGPIHAPAAPSPPPPRPPLPPPPRRKAGGSSATTAIGGAIGGALGTDASGPLSATRSDSISIRGWHNRIPRLRARRTAESVRLWIGDTHLPGFAGEP